MGVLYTIATIFLAFWVLGLLMHATFAVFGGFIHLALVVAIVLFIVGLIRGRTTV